MKKAFNFKKELNFEENVSSITSISLDTTFSEGKESVEGTFLIEGNYKTHELSINKKDFKFELPFVEDISNLKPESAVLEVEDFTYDLDNSNLTIDIDYEIDYEENEMIEEFDEEEFERFLSEHEVDIVNLNEDSNEVKLVEEITDTEEIKSDKCDECENRGDALDDKKEIESVITESVEDTIENKQEEVDDERVEIEAVKDEASPAATEVLLSSIDKEEKYITYHVHICESDDTFESIAEKFKTSKETIREYNEIDDIEYGRKLIIPVKDE